jgi:lipopolysaccharide/colanic/teichoic acid biosynthesis glycosyltransferase
MSDALSKRLFDVAWAALGLVVLAPVLLLIALRIKLAGDGPVFFRQQRVGQGWRLFWIWKFRTMMVGAAGQGPGITCQGDDRITPVGRWLRRTKLDELPQLWNVLRGDMSFVGPRPELVQYVTRYTPAQRAVLSLKPGITDLATLEFRDEEERLATASDIESFYLEHCLPRKIELNLQYTQRASRWQDTCIILQTLFHRRPAPARGEGSQRG